MVHSNTKLIQPIIFETHVHRARGVVALFLRRDARPFFPLGAPARAPESRHGFERLFIRREHLHFRTLFTRLQILAPVRVRSALKTKSTQKAYPDHVASRPSDKRVIINTPRGGKSEYFITWPATSTLGPPLQRLFFRDVQELTSSLNPWQTCGRQAKPQLGKWRGPLTHHHRGSLLRGVLEI